MTTTWQAQVQDLYLRTARGASPDPALVSPTNPNGCAARPKANSQHSLAAPARAPPAPRPRPRPPPPPARPPPAPRPRPAHAPPAAEPLSRPLVTPVPPSSEIEGTKLSCAVTPVWRGVTAHDL